MIPGFKPFTHIKEYWIFVRLPRSRPGKVKEFTFKPSKNSRDLCYILRLLMTRCPSVLTIYMEKPEISGRKSNFFRHSMREASESMGCDLRRCNFSAIYSLLSWFRYSLNFIRLLRVVITRSVTSESTDRWCRPVTSLLLCFNSCKKLNKIFKWQTEKYRLEMSAWYRMALLFSILIQV